MRRENSLIVLLILAILSCFQNRQTNASLVIGNLPATPAADNSASAGLNNLNQKAIRFTMGADAFIVDDVVIRLQSYNVAGEVFAQIRDFNGSTTSVGTATLINFTAPAPGGLGILEYSFSASSSYTLQPNTSYWLVLGGTVGQSFDWRATTTALDPYNGPASYNNGLFTSNGGTSWIASGPRNYFDLNGTAVPEPSALMLVLLSASLTAGRRRRA